MRRIVGGVPCSSNETWFEAHAELGLATERGSVTKLDEGAAEIDFDEVDFLCDIVIVNLEGWHEATIFDKVCRRRGIDPHKYLRDVLTPNTETTSWQVAELTPGKWAGMLPALHFFPSSVLFGFFALVFMAGGLGRRWYRARR